MVRSEPSGWLGLNADHLLELVSTEFEDFCLSLVAYEAYGRHVGPELDGGAGCFGAVDGGRDFILTLTQPPTRSKLQFEQEHHLAALTKDPIPGAPSTRIAYSCKAGKTWLDKAVKEACDQSERPVEVLAEGGFFILMINRAGMLDQRSGKTGQTPHERLRDAYWERIKQRDPTAPDPGPRIQIIDADKLVRFARTLAPGGEAERWLDRFGLVPMLRSLAQWRQHHLNDRDSSRDPVFDQARTQISEQLLEFVGREPNHLESSQVAYVVGKPGVGKTRLVLEALASDRAAAQRVRVALSATEADEAIAKGRLLRRHREVVLIVDDCLPTEARSLRTKFLSAAGSDSRACLIALIPAALDAVSAALPRAEVWPLEPFDHEHAQKVVANEIGRPINDGTVAALAKFSEGFPWFARLLALEYKAAGRPPGDLSEAVRWALASRREVESELAFDQLVVLRARSLLAVSLTRAIDWDELDGDTRARVARMVGLERWEQVIDTARDCEKRGLLRRRLGWRYKYVTPQVLEREIVKMLLGPDGPDPGARKLAEHGEGFLEEFLVTVNRLGLADGQILRGIVDAALEDLVAVDDVEQLQARALLNPRLRLLARERPEATARALRSVIEAVEPDRLRDRLSARRALVSVLEILAANVAAFADAEPALLRLACAENERVVSSATNVWASLFGDGEHLDLLERRLADPDPRRREVALRGVEAVLRATASVRARPPEPSRARASRVRGWSMLVECFADPDPQLAAAARRLAVEHLRGAVRFGDGEEVLTLIQARIDHWSPDERVQLREKLEEIREYDSEFINPERSQPEALERALAPRSFAERLRQQVGVWGPTLLRDDDDERDDVIAREGLSGAVPLRDELDWLVSGEAQRAHVFAYAIGRCDGLLSLFDDLRELARRHGSSWIAHALVARYLGGVASVGRRADAEGLLRSLQADSEHATTAALALVELGASQYDLRWLETALASEQVAGFALGELSRRSSWLDGIDDEGVLRLAGVCADLDTDEALATALELVVDRFDDQRWMSAAALALLERVLTRLAPNELRGMTDHHWKLGARLLLEAGRIGCVAQLAVTALDRAHGSTQYAWETLHEAARLDPSATFAAVARGIGELGPIESRLLTRLALHEAPFEWPTEQVLAWVGDEPRRARAAAAMARIDADELPEAHRELLRRFGPHGRVADAIAGQLFHANAAVPSITEHLSRQINRVRGWADDPEPTVATFARKLVADLEQSYEHLSALEDDLRHQYGT